MKYDYIISGAGCAGLSLLMRMIESGKFSDKKIMIVDRDLTPRNDRTWCFWEKENGLFDPIVFRRWSDLHFFGENFESLLNIEPYRYKMIRGRDFFQHCFETIGKFPFINMMEGNIESFQQTKKGVFIKIDGNHYEADYIFNSVVFEDLSHLKRGSQYYFLKQHFKGWVIKTQRPAFDPTKATLMDFRPSQEHGSTFCYVLPFSEDTALVEYTLFTKDLLQEEQYDQALKSYIEDYVTTEKYTIEESEFGVIPMTNYPFKPFEGNIVNIGTAGGQTKPSSGYTFQFIQKYTRSVVDALVATGKPFVTSENGGRFSFYDSTLLQVLDRKKVEGKKLFTDLFRHGDVQTVLKFLDNETTFREDINIMRRLPKGKFAMAALREIFKV
jgi:lycopene beta-cyclase